MIKTNFKPICVYVTYKLNRVHVVVSVAGVTVEDLIRLACNQLGISPPFHNFYVTRNDVVQDDKVVLYPFSQVKLHERGRQPLTPNLQTCLWQLSGQVQGWKNTDVLSIIAKEIYEEMAFEMQRLAHYGLDEATFVLPSTKEVPQGEVFIPPTWIRATNASIAMFNKCVTIASYIKDEFAKENLTPVVTGDCWKFHWKPKLQEMSVCLVTARDLVAMGYPAHQGDLFRTIHNRVGEAIATGDVQKDSLEAQKEWIRKNCPKE